MSSTLARRKSGAFFPENMNPIDRLAMVVEQLRLLGDEESADWLWRGVDSYIRHEIPISESLGLTGMLGRSPRYAYLRRQRDQHLRDALWDLDGNLSRLENEIGKYECLPFLRRQKPDPMWSVARRSIHEAALVGIGLPSTRKGLRAAFNWVEPEPSILSS
jgi:hypothetical protein